MVLRALLAIVLTVLFLVGRWNLQRLAINPDAVDFDAILQRSVVTVLIEPRLWLVIAGVLLLILMEMGAPGDVHAHSGRREARTSVRIFFVFNFYLVATIAWSPNDNPFPAVVDICLMLVTVVVVERAARFEKFVEAFWLWLELLLIAIGAFALFTQLFLAPAASADLPGRLSILGGGPNILGRFLGMLCLLMVAQSFWHGGGLRWSVAWRIVVAAVALILLLQTGSRGAFTGFLLGLLVLLVVRRMNVRLIAVGGIVILAFEYLFKVILDTAMIEFLGERWLVTTLEEGYLSARDVLLAEVYRLWLERPVFGGGLDSFEYYTFGLDRYPHNVVLEVAQAGGIVAVLLLLAWIVHVILSSWHRRNHYTEVGLSMTALIFGCALFSGDFYDSRLIFIFGVLTISSAEIGASREHEDRAMGLIDMTPSGPTADER
ncbi:MAG TPA: O-antigen ligase family protein [Vineibacter sp.]|nr:O-antigen ligase family protein [Vineibacter sp.]